MRWVAEEPPCSSAKNSAKLATLTPGLPDRAITFELAASRNWPIRPKTGYYDFARTVSNRDRVRQYVFRKLDGSAIKLGFG
jgi:hypothetical protein